MEHDSKSHPQLVLHHTAVAFGDVAVLQEISLSIWSQQIVAIVGPNGAGKSTLFRAIGGLVPLIRGRILFEDEEIQMLPVSERVRRGIIYVPEGMKVFPEMSVRENLEIGAYLNPGSIPERLAAVLDLFPELTSRLHSRSGALSGGQQRMVTLGRGLMSGARLLLLDDPFLGLSPLIVKRFCDAFRVIRRSGVTLFIAGQHVRRILNVADLAFLIEDGTITLSGPGTEVFQNAHLQQILFGLDPNPPPL